MLVNIILQLHGKKSSGSTSVYKPTAEEKRLWKLQGDFQEAVNPYSIDLVTKSSNVLSGSLGEQQYDFAGLNDNAQAQIANAQQGIANLQNGILPAEYQKNMEASIQSGVQNSVGNALNSLAGRGVLNSSVTNQAMNDISKNVSNTMAEQYSNNISTLNGLYGQQASLSGQGITTAAAAQESALAPALSLLNAALGAGSSTTGAVQALGGTGTTTTTTNNGSGLFNSILGAGSSIGSAVIACFTEDTDIEMADGSTKKICDIIPGDVVKSYDADKDEFGSSNVIDVMEPQKRMVCAVLATENGKRKAVTTTLTQPIMKTNGEWVLVSDLTVGTALKNASVIVGLILGGERNVYDIKVDGNGTYIANGFIAKDGSESW